MKQIEVYLSQKGGDMLAKQRGAAFSRDTETEKPVVNLFPEMRYQKILGFGGSFTETSAYNYAKLDEAARRKVIEAYFDPEKGLGYNFCRTHINSCDFSVDEYTYVEDGDTGLKTFSIDRDRRYILPFLKDALKAATRDELRLFASPWSPPAWMKDNHEMKNGGKLLEKYTALWAEYMARYLTEYGKEGVGFFAVSVQNEPKAKQTWESCVYTAEEEGLFVRDYLRPALDKAGFPDVKILIWDHNKERVYDRARDAFRLEGVRDSVWGIGFHWYSGDHFEALDMAHRAFPEKPLILTEFCLGGERGETAQGPHSSWDGFEIYARELIGDFNHHTAATVDWNMVVDETGGPFHSRPKGCKAQVVADHRSGTVSLEPTYYTVAHFSRFVRRGAVRIGCSGFDEAVKACTFQNPDGSVVAVLLNTKEAEAPVYLRLENCTAKVSLPAKSMASCVIQD